MRREGGVFQLMASFQNGRFSASSLTHTIIIPLLCLLIYSSYAPVYYSMHPQCNISSHSVTRSTMQRWQQAVMINSSKKVCIECQPIVLSKTMINLGRCCFHHNRHHPVRTVVAYQTMSVLKVSCLYSRLQAAATVHFLPI